MAFEKYELDKKLVGLTRIILGGVFLWPFLDKLLGLGFSTAPENAYLAGASPSQGYLLYATNQSSPFAFLFTDILGEMYFIVDILLMGMFLVVGMSLILGIMTRIGGISGAIFMISIILASWPFFIEGSHNPIIDAEHMVFALLLLLMATIPSGEYLGLGKRWSELSIVQKFPILR